MGFPMVYPNAALVTYPTARPVGVHGLLANHDRVAVVDGEAPRPALGLLRRTSLQGVPADEARFRRLDRERGTGLVGACSVACRSLGPVVLLQTQGVEGRAPRRDHAEGLPGLPEHVPEALP